MERQRFRDQLRLAPVDESCRSRWRDWRRRRGRRSVDDRIAAGGFRGAARQRSSRPCCAALPAPRLTRWRSGNERSIPAGVFRGTDRTAPAGLLRRAVSVRAALDFFRGASKIVKDFAAAKDDALHVGCEIDLIVAGPVATAPGSDNKIGCVIGCVSWIVNHGLEAAAG